MLPEGAIRAPRPKQRKASDKEEQDGGPERRSGRARKAVHKFGGVAIDTISVQRPKRKREEIEKTIFDPISTESDEKPTAGEQEIIPNDEIQVIRVVPEIGRIPETVTGQAAEAIDIANTTQEETTAPEPVTEDVQQEKTEKVSEDRMKRQSEKIAEASTGNNNLPPFSYKGLWFTEKDLAKAEANRAGSQVSRPVTNVEANGSTEFTGRYERPETMLFTSVPWERLPIPEHVATFYPKLRVPRKRIPPPNWQRILDETSALRVAQRVSPAKYSERDYKMSEDLIHERDHERRMAQALLRWQAEKERETQLNITEELWDSPDETVTTATYVTAQLDAPEEIKRDQWVRRAMLKLSLAM